MRRFHRWAFLSTFVAAVLISIGLAQLAGADTALTLAVASLTGFALICLQAFAVYCILRRISRSVLSLADGVSRLAEGNLEHRVQGLESLEARKLAEAFNQMASRFKGMFQDLTGERNKLSAVLDTMADGVIVIGPDGVIQLINRTAEQLFNETKQDTIGVRFAEIVRDHELQRMVSGCLKDGKQHQGEVELSHQRRVLSAITTPVAPNGSAGVLLTLHDLSQVRRVETTRREFVSNVSHELRSPLASIKAMVETMEDGAIEDKQVAQDFLHRIHQDVDRMSSMVGELLELSRLESGQVDLQLEPFHLAPLVDQVVKQCQALILDKSIRVAANVPQSAPQVYADRDMMRQVMVNLLENALKFTPQDGRVTISVAENGSLVRVLVEDTGMGISSENLPHIFERFYKVDRSRRDAGTGLGLAIVKHIVEAHGGDVSVKSQEGLGSTFTFTVPRAS